MTDLDLLVVLRSQADFVTRTAALYRELAVGVDLDLLVYTPEELATLKDGAFLRHILSTARVVYEKNTA